MIPPTIGLITGLFHYSLSVISIFFLFSPVGFTYFSFIPSVSSHFIDTDLRFPGKPAVSPITFQLSAR